LGYVGYKDSLNTATVGTGTPLIYNINSNQWVQKYARYSSNSSSSAPLPSPINGLNPSGDVRGEGGEAVGNNVGVNGAAIGSGIAGGAIVIAAIVLIFFRKRKQSRNKYNNAKHPEYVQHRYQDLASFAETDLATFAEMDTGSPAPVRFNWPLQKILGSPQLIRNDPQGFPLSPQSILPSAPAFPSDSFQPMGQQKRVRSVDQQLFSIQEQIRTHRNNPQFDSSIDQTPSASTIRGPQEGGEEVELRSDKITHELRYEMQLIEAELSRRGAM
jgi:hypothetical protein